MRPAQYFTSLYKLCQLQVVCAMLLEIAWFGVTVVSIISSAMLALKQFSGGHIKSCSLWLGRATQIQPRYTMVAGAMPS